MKINNFQLSELATALFLGKEVTEEQCSILYSVINPEYQSLLVPYLNDMLLNIKNNYQLIRQVHVTCAGTYPKIVRCSVLNLGEPNESIHIHGDLDLEDTREFCIRIDVERLLLSDQNKDLTYTTAYDIDDRLRAYKLYKDKYL